MECSPSFEVAAPAMKAAGVVASAGTIAQMHGNVAARPLLWDKVYTGIPPSPVTAVTVPGDRFTLLIVGPVP